MGSTREMWENCSGEVFEDGQKTGSRKEENGKEENELKLNVQMIK